MLKRLIKFFDRLEDKVRGHLSHYPIVYALAGGIGMVLFWRGVWHTADNLKLGDFVSLVLGSTILLITGVFVSAFVGNRLIISGLRGEKKLTEKAEEEIAREENQIQNLQSTLTRLEQKIDQHIEETEK